MARYGESSTSKGTIPPEDWTVERSFDSADYLDGEPPRYATGKTKTEESDVSTTTKAVTEAVTEVLEASKRRGASRAVQLKRLPDGTFAPKGAGQVLTPGTRVLTPDGRAGAVKADGTVHVSKGGMNASKIKVKDVKFNSLADAAKAGALPSQRNASGAQQRADAAKTNASMTTAQRAANAAQAAVAGGLQPDGVVGRHSKSDVSVSHVRDMKLGDEYDAKVDGKTIRWRVVGHDPGKNGGAYAVIKAVSSDTDQVKVGDQTKIDGPINVKVARRGKSKPETAGESLNRHFGVGKPSRPVSAGQQKREASFNRARQFRDSGDPVTATLEPSAEKLDGIVVSVSADEVTFKDSTGKTRKIPHDKVRGIRKATGAKLVERIKSGTGGSGSKSDVGSTATRGGYKGDPSSTSQLGDHIALFQPGESRAINGFDVSRATGGGGWTVSKPGGFVRSGLSVAQAAAMVAKSDAGSASGKRKRKTQEAVADAVREVLEADGKNDGEGQKPPKARCPKCKQLVRPNAEGKCPNDGTAIGKVAAKITRNRRKAEEAEVGKPGTNWKQVSPEAKHKLRGILNHYKGMAHPFDTCVADNSKRFGPDRARRICAVVKDLNERTTKWRKGGKGKVSEAELDGALELLWEAIAPEDGEDGVQLVQEALIAQCEPLTAALLEGTVR